jgi:uncharacterized membrane protein (UPF0127 family)
MVHINNQSFPAEYLTTPEEKERGMMGRESLEGCMVFKMGKGHHTFWMKNCLIPLDIVFVMNNRISHIHPNCEVPDSHRMNPPKYTGMGDHIIEFPAGTSKNWRVGDRVAMYLGTPQNPVRPSYP